MNKFLNSLLKTELINSSYIKYNLPIKNYFLIQWFPFSHTLIHTGQNFDKELYLSKMVELNKDFIPIPQT